MKNITNRKS